MTTIQDDTQAAEIANIKYLFQGTDFKYERIQPVKRKTWAESSILTGGVASNLGSTYAQDYHQPICPASKVYADTSSFQYERQSNSGHKIFKKK